jgi:hypothetical protein
MRVPALIFALLLPFAFVLPAQAADACECVAGVEMSAGHCCQMPVDCCLAEETLPSFAFGWVWERVDLQAVPKLILLATLALPEVSSESAHWHLFSGHDPPPQSARALRSFQQSWLI